MQKADMTKRQEIFFKAANVESVDILLLSSIRRFIEVRSLGRGFTVAKIGTEA